MAFYAVANGFTVGIFTTWDECNRSVKGYKHAIFKKFSVKQEAEAFITQHQQKQHDTKSVDIKENDFILENDFIPDYYVYTDGACSNNGKENAMAGIGIYFGSDDPRNVSKRITGKQTNNRAELTAIIETYAIIEPDIQMRKKIAIATDSEYVLKCIGSYGKSCALQHWKKEIPNKDLVQLAYELYRDKPMLQFIHVKAHTNETDIHSIGNANADRLANLSIGLEDCPYHIESI